MSYLVEIDKSDVQKMALTIAIIPCLLFAAGFLTATLSQSSSSSLSISAKPNNDVTATPSDTAPAVSVISEIIEPEAVTAEPVKTTAETSGPVAATEIAEPIATAEAAEPVTAIENGVVAQELSEVIEKASTPPLVSEEAPIQPLVSGDTPQVNQLFSVQVAAFREASNAIDYAVQLKAKGYPVEVTVENNASDTSIYKVLYGSFEHDKALQSAADFSQREKTTSFVIARS